MDSSLFKEVYKQRFYKKVLKNDEFEMRMKKNEHVFKHTISVLRDNDAQMGVQHTKKILKTSDVYKHRISVLCVNAARIGKINSPRLRKKSTQISIYTTIKFDIQVTIYIHCELYM